MAVVYRHIRLDNGTPFYIGIGKNVSRAYDIAKRTDWWKKIVNKVGREVEILFDDLSLDEAKKKEIEFIKLYGRINNRSGILINLTDGGDGSLNYKHTDKTKIKLSEITKERFKKNCGTFLGKTHSEISIKKMAQSKMGKKVSDESKLKMSHSRLGKAKSEQHKKAIQNALKGLKKTELHKLNCRESIKKSMNTPEMKAYLSLKAKEFQGSKEQVERKSKRILQFDINGNFIREYLNAKEVASNFNVKVSSVRQCVLGKSKTCKGFKLIYKN